MYLEEEKKNSINIAKSRNLSGYLRLLILIDPLGLRRARS
jgi:hypothetical protein